MTTSSWTHKETASNLGRFNLRCKEMGRTARGRGHVGKTGYVWKTALHQFDIMFPGRLELA